MELKFLGNGACFYPLLLNTSAYFIKDNNLILIDCGETVYEQLMKKEDIGSFDQIYVILTHLHSDHVGSIGSLLSYCKCILNKRIYVIHKEKTVLDLLKLLGIASDFYYYREELGELISGVSVVPYKVEHALDMICYGYEISYDEIHVYYSGDAANIPNEILQKFLDKKIQRLYQDTSTHDVNQASHMFIGKIEEKIPAEYRKNIYCMHIDSDCIELLKSKGFSIAGE